jgi:hypothetical protein
LKDLWNNRFPDKRFKTWRNFREYYLRGRKAALPRYKFPEPKPSAEKQQEMRAVEQRIMRSLEAHIEEHGNPPFKEIT